MGGGTNEPGNGSKKEPTSTAPQQKRTDHLGKGGKFALGKGVAGPTSPTSQSYNSFARTSTSPKSPKDGSANAAAASSNNSNADADAGETDSLLGKAAKNSGISILGLSIGKNPKKTKKSGAQDDSDDEALLDPNTSGVFNLSNAKPSSKPWPPRQYTEIQRPPRPSKPEVIPQADKTKTALNAAASQALDVPKRNSVEFAKNKGIVSEELKKKGQAAESDYAAGPSKAGTEGDYAPLPVSEAAQYEVLNAPTYEETKKSDDEPHYSERRASRTHIYDKLKKTGDTGDYAELPAKRKSPPIYEDLRRESSANVDVSGDEDESADSDTKSNRVNKAYEDTKTILPPKPIVIEAKNPIYATVNKKGESTTKNALQNNFKDIFQSSVTGDIHDTKHHWALKNGVESILVPVTRAVSSLKTEVEVTLNKADERTLSLSVKSNDERDYADVYARAILSSYLEFIDKAKNPDELFDKDGYSHEQISLIIDGGEEFDARREVLAEQFVIFHEYAKFRKGFIFPESSKIMQSYSEKFLLSQSEHSMLSTDEKKINRLIEKSVFQFDTKTTEIIKQKMQNSNSINFTKINAFQTLHETQFKNFSAYNAAIATENMTNTQSPKRR